MVLIRLVLPPAGGCLWATYIGVRTFHQHNDVMYHHPPTNHEMLLTTYLLPSLKSKGAEPYLMNESPKLLSRQGAIAKFETWRKEMGGESQ